MGLSRTRWILVAVIAAVVAFAAPALAQNQPPAPNGEIVRGGPIAADATWEKITLAEDCVCADGSPFSIWVREADLTRVVFYLEGGGICLSAETCALTGDGENDSYNWSLIRENPGFADGMFDFDDADNPFAGYTIVYVSLCTGDGYLGDAAREYAPGLTIQHRGYVDGTAALAYMAGRHPDAQQVVVVGKTAGSIAAPLYGGLASDLLPQADIVVLGAQSGGFPDAPDFNAAIIGGLWGAPIPAWEVNAGLTARDWGPPRFWIQAGLHDPAIVMARFDYAFDRNAARSVTALLGPDAGSLLDLIDANEAAIEAAGVPLASYTAPGDEHGLFEFDRFYEIEVGGVRFVDWVAALLAGETPADVHCDDCAAP